METEGRQEPPCAETCKVQEIRQRTQRAWYQDLILSADAANELIGGDEAQAEVMRSADENVRAANVLAETALASCPLVRGEKVGMRRRLFPTGCASPAVTGRAIREAAAYPDRMDSIMEKRRASGRRTEE